MNRNHLFFLSVIFILCKSQITTESYKATVTNGVWSVSQGSGGVADAKYSKSMEQIGWELLTITTDKTQPDSLQAYAAGYIEGAVSAQSIWNGWIPYNASTDFNVPNLADYVMAQDTWVRTQAKTLAPTSDYWAQVALILAQFDGLVKGYSDNAPADQQLSYLDQLYLQLNSEVGDIVQHLGLRDGTLKVKEEIELPERYSHCSVLVRLSDDGQTLYSAHDTWNTYNAMLRVFKYYNFNFNHPSTSSATIYFSSYPGFLQSIDDFYLTTQQLHVSETTNSVFNSSLFVDYLSIKTVPEWIRIMVANRMATSGAQWSQYFGEFNSGTYNNQWQVVDYKLFTPGQPLQPNTLWILEQVPGFIKADDQTPFLKTNGYWPSYNIPYYAEIYNISGYPAFYQQYGNEFSWSECARAKIFARDYHGVQTIDDMKRIMRYNQYQTDPLSLWDACRGISARCDLNTPWSNNTMNGMNAFGAIDSKITNNILIKDLTAWVISGPTWDSQPPFAWTNAWANVLHPGMPQVYDFEWILLNLNPNKK